MKAKIYKPTKTAMQSGKANTDQWILEFEQQSARFIDPLMGWTGSADMGQQVRLKFNSQEEAIRFAEKHNIAYDIIAPKKMKWHIKGYADNFS